MFIGEQDLSPLLISHGGGGGGAEFQHQNESSGQMVPMEQSEQPIEPIYAQFRDQSRFWIQRVAVPMIMVIGLFGNLITVVIMTRRRMRSTTNLYLAALAFVDMLYLVLTFILGLSHYPNMAERKYLLYWRLRPFLMMLTDACSNTSVWLTVTFTIERFIAVKYPMKGKVWCTEARAKKLIASVFAVAMMFVLPVPFEWKVIERQVEVSSNDSMAVALAAIDNDNNNNNKNDFTASSEPTEIAKQASEQANSGQQHVTSNSEPEQKIKIVLLALDNTEFGSDETYKTIYYRLTAVLFYFLPIILITLFNGFLIHSVHRSRKERQRMTNQKPTQIGACGNAQAYAANAGARASSAASHCDEVARASRAKLSQVSKYNSESYSKDSNEPSLLNARLQREPTLSTNASTPHTSLTSLQIVSKLHPISAHSSATYSSQSNFLHEQACNHRHGLIKSLTNHMEERRSSPKSLINNLSSLSADGCPSANMAAKPPSTELVPDGGEPEKRSQDKLSFKQNEDEEASKMIKICVRLHETTATTAHEASGLEQEKPQEEFQAVQAESCDKRGVAKCQFDAIFSAAANGVKIIERNIENKSTETSYHRSLCATKELKSKSLDMPLSASEQTFAAATCGHNGRTSAANCANGRAGSASSIATIKKAHACERDKAAAAAVCDYDGLASADASMPAAAHKCVHVSASNSAGKSLAPNAPLVGNGHSSIQGGGGGSSQSSFSMTSANANIWQANVAPSSAAQMGPAMAPVIAAASSQERRITIMLIAVVILFLTCQIPSATLLLYTSIYETPPNTNEQALLLAIGNIVNFLMAINAAGNFILYSFLSKKYRRTFVILFCNCFGTRGYRKSEASGQQHNHNHHHHQQQRPYLTKQSQTFSTNLTSFTSKSIGSAGPCSSSGCGSAGGTTTTTCAPTLVPGGVIESLAKRQTGNNVRFTQYINSNDKIETNMIPTKNTCTKERCDTLV